MKPMVADFNTENSSSEQDDEDEDDEDDEISVDGDLL